MSSLTGTTEIFVDHTPVTSIGTEDVRGGGITMGGGFQHYFMPSLALDLQTALTAGEFRYEIIRVDASGDSRKDTEQVKTTALRFNVGVSFYPMRRS